MVNPKFLLLVVISTLIAMGVSALDIKLNSEDKTDFAGFPAIVTIEKDEIQKFNTFVDSDDTIEVDDIYGTLTVQVLADRIYTGHVILKETTKKILLKPTAKVTGYVKDKRDNLLQNTKLKITCSPITPNNLPTSTDETGFFEIEEIGFGYCEINAIKDRKIATYNLDIDESKEYSVVIAMTDREKSYLPLFILVIVFVSIIILINLKYGKRKNPKIEQKTTKELSKRQEDIVATLSEREKTIVNQLTLHGTLTQSQLRHKTGLPKSSLHRTLTSLQQKNIVILKEDSGIKKISLTDFFKK